MWKLEKGGGGNQKQKFLIKIKRKIKIKNYYLVEARKRTTAEKIKNFF